MNYPISFAEQLTPHLRALRYARGVTQTQLGEQLGLSQARIADIEKNPGVVGLEQIIQILNALGARIVISTEAEPCDSTAERSDLPKGSW
jgi:HTH-type transcriptional regulator/antitoxin HipB